MRVLIVTMLVGCGFQPAAVNANGDGPVDIAPDVPACRSTCLDAMTLTDCATQMPVTCPLGCHTGMDTDRCALPVPSNGAVRPDLDGVTADLIVSADAVFDTDAGSITTAGATLRTGGFGLAPEGTRLTDLGDRVVLGVRNMHIDPGVTLSVVGTRSVIVLASTDVLIKGIFDASAGIAPCASTPTSRCGGAGGGTGGVGGATPSSGNGCSAGAFGFVGGGDETGGGGGGYAGAQAGDGGNGNNNGGAGGAGGCSTQQIMPLVGGSGGGGGGNGGSGGGGGGAIQITALGTIRVVTPTSQPLAGIKANGAGGQHGNSGGSHDAAGGGGSGGAILLEAQSVTVDGAHLVANAGGGGAGNGGGDGQSGGFDGNPAAGGTSGFPGGAGGSRLGTPQNGTGGGDGTGGGGGGVGRIFINCGNGYFVKLGSTDISPGEFTGVPQAM